MVAAFAVGMVFAQETVSATETNDVPVVQTELDDFISGAGPVEYNSGYQVTTIRSFAFAESRLLQRVSAQSVTSIGRGAFLGCVSLKTVELPAITNVTTFGSMFAGCIKLEWVDLPQITIEQAKAAGFPWQTTARAVVFHLADGNYDKNGRKL